MIGIMYGEHNMVEKRPIENMVEMVGIWFESEPTHVDWAASFLSTLAIDLENGDPCRKFGWLFRGGRNYALYLISEELATDRAVSLTKLHLYQGMCRASGLILSGE